MSKLKSFPLIYQLALNILNRVGYFDWKFLRNFPNYQPTERWKERINIVVQAPDNEKIDRVPEAGELTKQFQYMHNGLKICLGSYYDYGNTALLQRNRGVHEPQEEYVFQEVLKQIPAGSTMLELGSYWAFYSMWFHRAVAGASCYMVEPDPYKMNFGKLNFKLNGFEGTFIKGFIDERSRPGTPPTLSVDDIMTTHSIEQLSILHSDIQGYEYPMLKGAQQALAQQRIDYVFISTHSNELHTQCLEHLAHHQYEIIADADLIETYSWDGLIVARSPRAPKVPSVNIAKRDL